MNMVKCLSAKKKMPKIFWLEAVNWDVFVLNRCPTAAVKDKTQKKKNKEVRNL